MGRARGDYGFGEPMKDALHGRFIDAVSYAVQQPEFYADWIPHDDPGNQNNGRVEEITVHELKESNLVEATESSH